MASQKPLPAAEPPRFEEALGRLEEIVRELEEGEIGLAESLARYEEGVKLLRQCHTLLEGAERKIMLLSGLDAEGNPVVVPFDEEEALSLETKARGRSRRRTAKADDSAESPRRKPTLAEEPCDEGPGLF
ncbi:MAG: exodeoxyribonuclease VII small subunit [Pirellulales bacterium]|nr:exodeoxyribonuclease VII small subunit [Pirellulales bacterium]